VFVVPAPPTRGVSVIDVWPSVPGTWCDAVLPDDISSMVVAWWFARPGVAQEGTCGADDAAYAGTASA